MLAAPQSCCLLQLTSSQHWPPAACHRNGWHLQIVNEVLRDFNVTCSEALGAVFMHSRKHRLFYTSRSTLSCTSPLQALAYECNSTFSRVLAERMTFYATDPSADTINRVKVRQRAGWG